MAQGTTKDDGAGFMERKGEMVGFGQGWGALLEDLEGKGHIVMKKFHVVARSRQ